MEGPSAQGEADHRGSNRVAQAPAHGDCFHLGAPSLRASPADEGHMRFLVHACESLKHRMVCLGQET